MSKLAIGQNVLDASLDRLTRVYANPENRVVVAFSGGKDSTVCLELAVLAAQKTNRLPVEAFCVDTEIMVPGVNEFIEQTAEREDIDLTVFVRPDHYNVNGFSRREPLYKAYDPAYKHTWVNQPIKAKKIVKTSGDLQHILHIESYPWDWENQWMVKVVGIRADESPRRRLAISSSGGFLTKPDTSTQVISCRPVYDWSDGDVWLALKKFNWSYCPAYDKLFQAGVQKKELRLAPPLLGTSSLHVLQKAKAIWPALYERLCNRVDGLRDVMLYGKAAITPERNAGETWEQAYSRLCLHSPYQWIADRAELAIQAALANHARHSQLPFPEVVPCLLCPGSKTLGSWKNLTIALYNGDPICLKIGCLKIKPVLPEVLLLEKEKAAKARLDSKDSKLKK